MKWAGDNNNDPWMFGLICILLSGVLGATVAWAMEVF
jgi:hypothetical protein